MTRGRLEMSDDMAITIAMLHGCEFWLGDKDERWYVHDDIDNPDPCEEAGYAATNNWGWNTRPDLARAYCRFYELDLLPEEVT